MDKTIKDKLLSLSDYADAKPILETVKNLSESAYTLAQTAYQIKETQPQIASNFLKTVIQEMEDHEEKEKKKVEEIDGGTEHQASSTTGLAKIGKEEPAPEGMTSDTDVNDQMGVSIDEMAPMGQPQQQPIPPQIPPQQPQQQMNHPVQYTVQEAKAIRHQFTKISEAIKSLDKKITETQNSRIRSMDIGTSFKGEKPSGSFIRETTGNKEQDLQVARHEIQQMNDAINAGTI